MHSGAPSGQIDADGFGFSGLLVDAHFKGDDLALGDFIAVSQCRDVKENVDATIIRFDKTKPLFLVEHLDFTSWHAVLEVFPSVNLEPTCAAHKDGAKSREDHPQPEARSHHDSGNAASTPWAEGCPTQRIARKPILRAGSPETGRIRLLAMAVRMAIPASVTDWISNGTPEP